MKHITFILNLKLKGNINEAFQDLFEVINLTVLGKAELSLIQILESWDPVYLSYIDGFNKHI